MQTHIRRQTFFFMFFNIVRKDVLALQNIFIDLSEHNSWVFGADPNKNPNKCGFIKGLL